MRRVAALLLVAACGGKPPPPPPKPAPVHVEPAHTRSAKFDERVAVLDGVDPSDQRSIDAAIRAAASLGADKSPQGIDELIKVSSSALDGRVLPIQVAAIHALGKYPADDKIVTALVQILDRPTPKHQVEERDPDEPATGTAMAMDEHEPIGMQGELKRAAIDALGDLHSSEAVEPLVAQLYRSPELAPPIRRALVAIGTPAEQALTRGLRGESSAAAARALGDFRDPASVQPLLAAPPSDGVFEALARIGSAEAAAPVLDAWMKNRTVAAITAYAFLARDSTGADELGKIAADNTAEDQLRIAAALAYARLEHDDKAIALMQSLAKRYLDASAKKHKEAEPHRKAALAADKELAPKMKAAEEAKAKLLAATKDPKKTVTEIKGATATAKKAEDELRVAKRKHREQVAPFKLPENAANAYLGYARMFQAHIARIEIAIHCKQELACYAGALTGKDVNVKKYIPDLAKWTRDERRALHTAQVDRAILEIGKQGAKASDVTDAVLAATASDEPEIRDAALLALPKIAPSQCPSCITKLDEVVRAAKEPDPPAELVREYFRQKH